MEKTRINPNSLTTVGHLEELRKRIIYCIGFLLCGTVLSFFFARNVIYILQFPANEIIDNLVFIKPTEVLTVYFKVSLYTGMIISSPAIFYHFWKFIKPAISKEVNVSLISWIFSIVLLFVFGTIFAYEVAIPFGLNFLLGFSKNTAYPMITLNNYISFVLLIMILAGLIFEMPVLSAFLTRIRVITPSLMKQKRREAVFILFVLAAVLTPTTDIFNMVIFVIPMIILYEVSILVSGFIYKSVKRKSSEKTYKNEV